MKTILRNTIIVTITVFIGLLCFSSPLFASSNIKATHADLVCTDCHRTQPDPTVDTRDTVDFITSTVKGLCASCHFDNPILDQTISTAATTPTTWVIHKHEGSIPQEMYDFYVNWLSGTSLEGFRIYENEGVYSYDCLSCHFLPSGRIYPDIPMHNAEMCVACHGGAGNYDPGVTGDVFSSMPRILYNPQHLGVTDVNGVEYPAPSDPNYNGQPPLDGDSVSGEVPLPGAFFQSFHTNFKETMNYRVDISGPANFIFTETDSLPMSWYTGIDNVTRWVNPNPEMLNHEKQMYYWDTSSFPDGSYVVNMIPYNPTDPTDTGTAYTLNLEVGTLTPMVMLEQLISDVVSMNLQAGISNALDAKLDTALSALDDMNNHNDGAAINTLNAFINAVEAQRGNKITDEDADNLIAVAQEIIAALSGS